MKLIIVGLSLMISACTSTSPQKLSGKEIWNNYKTENSCQKNSDKKINYPQSAFSGGGVWAPSTQPYTQWSCANNLVVYSPYDN